MQIHDVDVVVVGLGPGGEDAAGALAQAGLKVVGVESHLVGGECPYYGCIPSKMIIRAADLLAEAARVNEMAGTATVVPNYTIVADRIRDEATDDWNDQVAVDRFVGKGGIFVRGRGALDGPGRVIVGDDVYVASRGVILATGTSPAIPPVPGLADAKPWTNRDIFKVRAVPPSMIVVGGGAIGLELAQAFSRFGAKVTIIEALDRILGPEEPESSELVAKVLRAEGIDVRTGVGISSVTRDRQVSVTLADRSVVTADEILVAAGRTPNVRGIGLDTVGIDEAARPTFSVDEHMRVHGADRLWAIGDIAGKGAFTHMAVYEAGVAVDDILGAPSPRTAQDHAVSRVTFTDPEVGSVGMTEAQARAAGINVRVGLADSSTSSRGWLHGAGNEGLMKLVADADRGILVGATAVGPRGGDLLGLFNLAVHARVPIAELQSMIYAYPTFYRGALDALASLAYPPPTSSDRGETCGSELQRRSDRFLTGVTAQHPLADVEFINSLASSRHSLHRVAVHVVARARVRASGRFSLRVAPNGFGTPDLAPDGGRVRVSGMNLVVESDAPGGAAARSIAIHGSSLAQLAAFAGVDLSEPLDVGHDTPPVGDADARLVLSVEGCSGITGFFGLVAAMLDRVLAELPAAASPTLPRLWPEHFDVAIEAQARPDRRVNLGGSPGDGVSDEPYLYVGPWTADRPGDAAFWNAPFGAFRTLSQLAAGPVDIVTEGAAFLLEGYRRLV